MEEIRGVVEGIMFHAEDTGYTVLQLECDGEDIAVVCFAADINCGEEIAATGQYVSHPSYGRQFKADKIEQVTPATATAILRYLSGGAVRGVGPVMATRIVGKYGDKTLEIMENEPERLSLIKGISIQKAKYIGAEYKRVVGVRAVMAFLSAYGIEPMAAVSAWKKWGAMAKQMISGDPYCLCNREIGVPFAKADQIAISLGFEVNSPCRVRGGALYVLEHNLGNGHTCLPLEKLASATCALLEAERDSVLDGVDELRENGEAIGDKIDGITYIYLPQQYAAEVYSADRLSLMLRFLSPDRPLEDDEIAALENELNMRYAEKQREALRYSIDFGIMILTGGPGTGKTTTLNGIITLFERRGMKVALAAPTGRAAKRLSEVTGREAKTIHRLLEVDFGSKSAGTISFKRNEKNLLPYDAIVVDEMSMVDSALFASLLKAVRNASRLILVGDPDQLPSVGAGNVLRDLIDCEAVSCVHLTEVFRQAANSLIVTSAHEIVSGNTPDLNRRDKDFFFLPEFNQEKAAITCADLVCRRLPKAYGYCSRQDIQVITPTKKGAAGTVELNALLQKELNPAENGKRECKVGALTFREGDKVMQIKNNYDIEWIRPDGEEGLGIFNGDIGIIEIIDRPTKSVMIDFDDRKAVYNFDMLIELDLAYAITVHKSQGNEFDAVVMPLAGRHPKLHYRNLLYTAVTRAKKLLVIVGQAGSVREMVENNRKTLRYTNLAARIRSECKL